MIQPWPAIGSIDNVFMNSVNGEATPVYAHITMRFTYFQTKIHVIATDLLHNKAYFERSLNISNFRRDYH